jgi:hypothetical protein
MLRRNLGQRTDDLKEFRVKPLQSHGKGKAKQNQNNMPKETTTFKKKKNNKEDEDCFVCGSPDHWAKKCPNRKGRKHQPEQKTMNRVVSSSGGGTSGYDNLPYVLPVFQSTTWWLDTDANVYMCSYASLFSSYQVSQDSTVMMGNGSHASVHGVGMVDLKLTLRKIVQLKNEHHVPSINKNLVSGSLLCRDSFKVVLELNKFVMSKCGQFIGKGYVCGSLFHFSISDFCNKFVNNICDGINESDASVSHSHLCHLNFGSKSQLSSINLILNLLIVKCSKCQSCVQSKQPRKSHKAAKERHLTLLELIHSDICEMNGVLTEGGQRYFMTMIDDVSRYCYVYLLITKDEALNCFKTYKAEVENQLEQKDQMV